MSYNHFDVKQNRKLLKFFIPIFIILYFCPMFALVLVAAGVIFILSADSIIKSRANQETEKTDNAVSSEPLENHIPENIYVSEQKTNVFDSHKNKTCSISDDKNDWLEKQKREEKIKSKR